jgi:hypothetical protein
MRVLAFDIGIKNLAWCCADIEKTNAKIQGWANENIITGGTAEEDIVSKQCKLCKHKAKYGKDGQQYCVRHCPPLTPAFRDLSGTLLQKIPSMAVVKEIALKSGAEKKTLKTKEAAIEFLKTKYCMPLTQTTKVKKMELEELHDGLQNIVIKNADLFSSCDEILLENQPVFKNPVMKSIQMMLFATLRDFLEKNGKPPRVRLVHAGRKTEGATGGDEGYSERKHMSEERVLKGFETKTIQFSENDTRDKEWFSKQVKKSDLADCLCMCMDTVKKAA